jgi:CRISPR-associated protein Csy2
MPGFVLQERKDLVEKSMEKGIDALDALLDHLEVTRVESDENGQKPEWAKKSGEPGWLVPLSVGYHALSAPGRVANQRDPGFEHCFAENVLTLGEFVMPIRLDRVEQLLWHPKIDESQGLYLYTQTFQNKGD